jgi:hypothetical protein
MIHDAPTGVSWSIIPFPKASDEAQRAEQTNICWRATGLVDGYCNQVIRATIDTEVQSGPNFRITIEQGTGNARYILQRWPVTDILAVQVSANASFPRRWSQLGAGMFDIEHPVIGLYGTTAPSAAGEGGQSILLAPGSVSWALGRNGYRVSATYVNGWPHAGLTEQAQSGDTVLHVDDVTGFAGAAAFIYDGSKTEVITAQSVTATTLKVLPNNGGTAPAGPGTLTLPTALTAEHGVGVVVSSVPQDILWASVLAATSQALEAGITSVSIQNLPGSETLGGHGVDDLKTEYKNILGPYRRVI